MFYRFTTAGISSSFVDSGGNNSNFLADVGEIIRCERAYTLPRVVLLGKLKENQETLKRRRWTGLEGFCEHGF